MIHCNQCGKENTETTKFCTACGNNLLASLNSVSEMAHPLEPKINDDDLICKHCGGKNKAGTKFCVSCGAQLQAREESNSTIEATYLANESDAQIFCTQCGQSNRSAVKFCISCGNKLEGKLQRQGAVEQTVLDKKKLSGAESSEPEKLQSHLFDVFKHNESSETEEFNNTETPEIIDEIEIPGNYSLENNAENGWPITEKASEELDGDSVDKTTIKNEGLLAAIGFKKIILGTAAVLVIISIAIFFLVGKNTTLRIKDKATGTELVDQVTKSTQGNATGTPAIDSTSIPPVKPLIPDSVSLQKTTIENKNSSSSSLSENKKSKENANNLQVPNVNMALNELDGKKVCNDVIFSKGFTVISYKSQKTAGQCNTTLTFKVSNSDAKYAVTLHYQKEGDRYVYSNSTCLPIPTVAKEQTEPAPSINKHNVREDIMNYLSGRKSFGGIPYNNLNEIAITKVGNMQYYEESGNTSYEVELTINNIIRRCQVNYTILGKVYVNLLK